MTAWLKKEGHEINPKRVRRLMRLMGIETIYPRPRLSVRGPDHKIYPYLLKGFAVAKPDEVWCADITYIRLAHGFVYLVVILDWHSRYVLSWELSITLEKEFCLEALRRALNISKPEIFNTDQGAQFTSLEFVVAEVARGAGRETAKRRTDLARLRIFFAEILPSLPGFLFFGIPEALDLVDIGMAADGLFVAVRHCYNYNYF